MIHEDIYKVNDTDKNLYSYHLCFSPKGGLHHPDDGR